jgi:nitronate monooxygenase
LFKPYFDELSIPMPELNPVIPSKFEQQVQALLEIKPAVFSFIFGAPSAEILRECRKRRIVCVGAATTVEEGVYLEEAGVDAIVAAGFEAGGHRPSFLRPAEDSLTGVFALVQQLKGRVKVPVIAAGGIANGRGIAAALTLGADAVQLGTTFLASNESAASPLHKRILQTTATTHTVLSKSLTGRMGRMIHNRIAAGVPYTTEVLPFPLQNRFLGPLKEAALAQGRADLVNLWCGQNATGVKAKGAASVMRELIAEVNELL